MVSWQWLATPSLPIVRLLKWASAMFVVIATANTVSE